MIIYGWRTRESTLGQGVFDCPCCRTQQTCRHVAMRRWFTLYFIPVIPLGQVGQQVECQGCFSRYSPDVMLGQQGASPMSAIVLDETQAAPLRTAQPFVSPIPSLPTNSTLATVSLVLGLASPVFLCACGLSLFSSIAAIATGHMALLNIRRSEGKLGGKGMAISGLSLGYVLLLVSIFYWVRLGPVILGFGDDRPAPAAQVADTPEERLLEAELEVLSPTEGVASGNTPEAKEIAAEYSASLRTMCDELFTKDRERMLTLTAGHFLVHCELHADRCAFIVHVPVYRGEVREVLEMSAWVLAQKAVEGKLPPGSKLAVGLRGTVLYGAIMEGQVVAAGDEVQDFMRRDRDDLLAYFPATVVEAPGDADAAPEVHDQPAPMPAEVAPANVASAVETPAPSEQPPLVASIPPIESPPAAPSVPSPEPKPIEPKPIEPKPVKPMPAEPMPPEPPSKPRPPRRARQPAPALPALTELAASFPNLDWGVQSLAFAPGGRFLAAGKSDDSLLVFDVEQGSRVHAEAELRDLGQVTNVAFSFDGSRLFAAGYSGAIRSWEVDGEGRLSSPELLQGHAKPVTCLVASPAARFVASGSAGGELMWQSYANSAQPPRSLAALERDVLAIYLPRDRLEGLATDGRKLIQFDLREGKITRSVSLGRGIAQDAAFSSDGTQLAVVSGYEIRLCDTQTGKALETMTGAKMQWTAGFLPSGKGLVSGGGGEANVWRLPAGEPAARVDLGGVLYVQTLAISADGKLLAAIPNAAGQTLTVVRLPESP
jgi:WD40 repeat protein